VKTVSVDEDTGAGRSSPIEHPRRISVRISSALCEALDQAAAEQRIPRAKLIRRHLATLGPEGCDSLPERSGLAKARGGPSLRERIVAVMEASPAKVFTPARLAKAIGWQNRDSIRNTLLVLAAKGKIEKVGAGQYRGRRPEFEAVEKTAA
jgi:hypothetical protein